MPTRAATPREHLPAESAAASGGRWLELEEPHSLLEQACAPPWEGELGRYTAQAVEWELAAAAGGSWEHHLVWCERSAGAVAIHRFTPRAAAAGALQGLATRLSALAAEEMAAGSSSESASNVGGFHGERDLWWRPEVQESLLPELVGNAVQQVRLDAMPLRGAEHARRVPLRRWRRRPRRRRRRRCDAHRSPPAPTRRG